MPAAAHQQNWFYRHRYKLDTMCDAVLRRHSRFYSVPSSGPATLQTPAAVPPEPAALRSAASFPLNTVAT